MTQEYITLSTNAGTVETPVPWSLSAYSHVDNRPEFAGNGLLSYSGFEGEVNLTWADSLFSNKRWLVNVNKPALSIDLEILVNDQNVLQLQKELLEFAIEGRDFELYFNHFDTEATMISPCYLKGVKLTERKSPTRGILSLSLEASQDSQSV